ncbi:hypothetical protein [Streptomyces sp. NPDC001530]|uniref:hypothetical protein n=1 Tax=Streptomyces sp. NPDC001530 TaxID=3364582 RepID=UPI00367EE87C
MTVVLVAAFLIVHGLLHPGVWTAPQQSGEPAPFDPGHSWALTAAHVSAAPARAAALALAWYTALVYAIAGAGVIAGSGWWDTGDCAPSEAGLSRLRAPRRAWPIRNERPFSRWSQRSNPAVKPGGPHLKAPTT